METQFSNIQITLKICLHFDKEHLFSILQNSRLTKHSDIRIIIT